MSPSSESFDFGHSCYNWWRMTEEFDRVSGSGKRRYVLKQQDHMKWAFGQITTGVWKEKSKKKTKKNFWILQSMANKV